MGGDGLIKYIIYQQGLTTGFFIVERTVDVMLTYILMLLSTIIEFYNKI